MAAEVSVEAGDDSHGALAPRAVLAVGALEARVPRNHQIVVAGGRRRNGSPGPVVLSKRARTRPAGASPMLNSRRGSTFGPGPLPKTNDFSTRYGSDPCEPWGATLPPPPALPRPFDAPPGTRRHGTAAPTPPDVTI